MDGIEKARAEALERMYQDIASTGQPTEAQMKMIHYLENKESEFSPANVMRLFGKGGIGDMLLPLLFGGGKSE